MTEYSNKGKQRWTQFYWAARDNLLPFNLPGVFLEVQKCCANVSSFIGLCFGVAGESFELPKLSTHYANDLYS